jgi:uncharacterized protein YukE
VAFLAASLPIRGQGSAREVLSMASQGGNAWESMAAVLSDLANSINQTVSQNKSNWTGSAADKAWADMSTLASAALSGQSILGQIGDNIQNIISMESMAQELAKERSTLENQIVSKIELASVPTK